MLKEIQKHWPSATMEINKEGNKVYYLNKDLDIKIHKSYDGKYHVHKRCTYKWIDTYTKSELLEEHKAPNNFKVLKTSIIQKWVDYVLFIDNELKKISEERQGNIDKFLHVVGSTKLSDTFEKDDFVYSYNIQEDGYIEQRLEFVTYKTDDFVYSYNIQDSGYIEQRLEFVTYKTDLSKYELFKKYTDK